MLRVGRLFSEGCTFGCDQHVFFSCDTHTSIALLHDCAYYWLAFRLDIFVVVAVACFWSLCVVWVCDFYSSCYLFSICVTVLQQQHLPACRRVVAHQ